MYNVQILESRPMSRGLPVWPPQQNYDRNQWEVRQIGVDLLAARRSRCCGRGALGSRQQDGLLPGRAAAERDLVWQICGRVTRTSGSAARSAPWWRSLRRRLFVPGGIGVEGGGVRGHWHHSEERRDMQMIENGLLGDCVSY